MLEYFYYTFIYFLLVILICLFHIVSRQNKRTFLLLSFILLFVFAAISFDVGWDYLTYYKTLIYDLFKIRFEKIELHIAQLSMGLNYPQLFFIINHFIITLFITLSIGKESPNPYLSVIVFLCFPLFYLGGLSLIRFSAATSIVLFGYFFFLKERKILLFMLTLAIAYYFHSAILIAALLIPLNYINLSRKANVLLLIFSFIVSKAFMSWFSSFEVFFLFGENYDRLNRYLMSGGDVGGQSKIHYFFLAINIFNLIEYNKLKNMNENIARYITFFNIGCCIAFLFSSNTVLMSRFSRLYYFFVIFLIPYYGGLFPKISTKNANSLIIFISILLLAYQLSIPNYNGFEPGRVSTYWPYRVYFLNQQTL